MKHLESAFKGDNEWWKYLLMLTIIPFFAQIPAVIPLFIARSVTELPEGVSEADVDLMNPSSFGLNSTIGLVLLVFIFVCMLLGFIIFFKLMHGKSYKTVINGTNSIRWRRMLIGFAVCFVVEAFFLVTDYYLDINNYEVRLNWQTLIPLALVALVFIPFQAGYEEVMLRGYIAQGIARLTKNRIAVILIPSILFALLHGGNPEIKEYGFWAMMPFYFISGLSYALISVLDDGIELAIGLHSANNIFSSIFITTESSAIKTDALLFMKEVNIPEELLPFIISQVVVFAAVAYKYRWRYKILFEKIKPEPVVESDDALVH